MSTPHEFLEAYPILKGIGIALICAICFFLASHFLDTER